ncbi:Phosphatidylglycerol--membrane-oligosaccharide glycerophosphotransferase [Lentibacillus sp. JNUCC-1]|nr:Phosphatidylglycerol--membrane-oligosaccharide glycerophosphotransferase [Lentibacillus sp. JNUCC-1]
MPEDKELLDLPAEYNGTLTGDYLQSVRYADHTLGLFIDDLKEKGLWEDTVIALYGDHSGVHGRLVTDKDVQLLHDLVGQPYSLPFRFNIPFIVSIPGDVDGNKETIETMGGQLDMMPTVLNIMGVEPPALYFGQDLLTYHHNLFGMRYYAATGTFFNDDVLFLPETSKRDIRVYNLDEKSTYKKENVTMGTFRDQINKLLQIYKWSDAYFNSLDNK